MTERDNDMQVVDKEFTDNLAIKDFLGQGGVGRVFLAIEQNLERDVAIKELIPEKLATNRDKKIARFVREAKLAGQLQHPGIIPIYSLSQKSDGAYYYVMKYVHGRTLHGAIKDCGGDTEEMSFRRRMTLLDKLIAVCDAMGYAHSKGVVHRDLKPSNVVLGEFGETVILDWGLAKHLDEEEPPDEQTLSGDAELDADAKLTRQGAILGTPAYLAPEQVDSEWGPVDARSDVYTLGVILFMLLTGHRPYIGSAKDVMGTVVSELPSPSPTSFCRCIPPELTAICAKAMTKEKAGRFADASELAKELRAYRDGRLVSVYAYSKGELFRKFVARNKAAIIAASLVIASIVAGAGFSLNFAYDAHVARQKALAALEEVTTLSESAMMLARSKASLVYKYFDRLDRNMNTAAKKLSVLNFKNAASVKSVLKWVDELQPEAVSFQLVLPSGEVVQSYPEDDAVPQSVGANEIAYWSAYLAKEPTDETLHLFETADGRKAFALSAPVMKGKRIAALLTAKMLSETAIPHMLDFDPKASPYQVWLMKDDGLIVYDEDEKQIGINLFSDRMYENFPELLKFGEKIEKEPWGIGHYAFTGPDGESTIYKVAAWDTLRSDGTEWKLVITHPYISK